MATPWLAQGVLDLRVRFRRIVDLAEYIDRPHLAEVAGIAIWYMTQVDGCVTAWSTVVSHLRSWTLFCEFLDADVRDGWPEITTAQDLTPQHVIRFAAYLIPRYPIQHTRARHFYNLTGCLHALRSNAQDRLGTDFVVPAFPERLTSTPGTQRRPYTEAERFEIVRLCRHEIASIVHRLQVGRKLLAAGKDPTGRRGAWRSQANVLWYVRHVLNGAPFMDACRDIADHSSLAAAFCKRKAGYPSRNETYSYLYPHIEDLAPFIVLLHALLDENSQCIMDLKLTDIELTEDARLCRIRFMKTRPVRKEFTKIYSNSSMWSPGRVIDTVKRITEPLRRWTDDSVVKDSLWVYLARRGEPVHRVLRGEPSRMVSAFGRQHGISDLTLSRFRVTNLSLAYRRTGNLALIKDRARHAQMQTTVHYLTNPGTSDLHSGSISDAQSDALSLVPGAVVVLDEAQSEAKALADVLHVKRAVAKRIVAGEQDVFVASCRDFYNRPGGPPNTPCDRPFACFSCRNAVWLSRILPRLIRFRDFLLEQRENLPSEEWAIRFGFPYRVITEVILPSFNPETVSLAEAEASSEPFYVPVTMRSGQW